MYYGHTDPFVSSTGLSTLIAEFYASARQNGFTGRQIDLQQVRDTDVQAGVRAIEQLIRHYSTRTTEFKEYIAQGPGYLDFVALDENGTVLGYAALGSAPGYGGPIDMLVAIDPTGAIVGTQVGTERESPGFVRRV